nr:uncharacterized protein LOC124214318 [Neodiprion pinetum]
MGHQSCCVVDCKNTSRNSNCKFYKFPVANWKLNQRKKWIAAVKRQNIDGSLWSPKPMDVICSEHFISGEKSDIESSPNFAPTIFPSAYRRRKVNESAVLNRHKRFMERRIMKKSLSSTAEIHPVMNFVEPPEIAEGDQNNTFMNQTVEQACEANIYFTSNVSSKTFICNRYITNNKCDAETQTEILEASTSKIITNNKKYVNKECGTPHRTFADHETQVTNMFEGFSSVKKNEQLIDLVLIGITPGGFIYLKSKVAGGRKSDSQMTIESGLLDLLEDGDVVLADKGFPEIKTFIDASGKKLKMVMPPFLEKKSEFTTQQTQETYSIAKLLLPSPVVKEILLTIEKYLFLEPHNIFLFLRETFLQIVYL